YASSLAFAAFFREYAMTATTTRATATAPRIQIVDVSSVDGSTAAGAPPEAAAPVPVVFTTLSAAFASLVDSALFPATMVSTDFGDAPIAATAMTTPLASMSATRRPQPLPKVCQILRPCMKVRRARQIFLTVTE